MQLCIWKGRPVARIFEKGFFFLGKGGGGGISNLISLIIHEIYNMYSHFVVIHPLPLILLPNESLVQMLSNICFYQIWLKIWPCIMAKQSYIM